MSVQDYEPGDIIQGDCQPFFKTVSINTQKGQICDGCFGTRPGTPLRRCTGCLCMYYCSAACQKNDWKNGHKIECGSNAFKKSFEDINSVEIRCQLLRGFAFLKMRPEMAKKGFPVYDGTSRCYDDLPSLPSQDSFDSTLLHQVLSLLAMEMSAEGLGDEDAEVNRKYLLKMAGIFHNNALAIRESEETPHLGMGVYIEPSALKHSCKPNALVCAKGTRMEIRATAPIKKGEKPRISYLGAKHLGKDERKDLLMIAYRFDCRCERCESEEDDGVDFHKLNTLIEFFGRCVKDEGFAASNSEERLLAKHREVIQMMKKMYNDYDDPVTNQYKRMVYALINGRKCLLVPEIKKLIEKAKIQLKISYGEDHIEYIELERALALDKLDLKNKRKPSGSVLHF